LMLIEVADIHAVSVGVTAQRNAFEEALTGLEQFEARGTPFPRPFFEWLGPADAEEVAREQIAWRFVMLTRFVSGLAVAVAGQVGPRLGTGCRDGKRGRSVRRLGYRLVSPRRTGANEEQPGGQQAPSHTDCEHRCLLPWKTPFALPGRMPFRPLHISA